uniref:U31-Theraphotoxin-Sfo1a_1 n=1 Tax=Selenotholus foelschei TaxID=1905327 RepID=A0A482ZAV8_9ARAC
MSMMKGFYALVLLLAVTVNALEIMPVCNNIIPVLSQGCEIDECCVHPDWFRWECAKLGGIGERCGKRTRWLFTDCEICQNGLQCVNNICRAP